MIVLVHSGITGPEMWDGFELPGELRRQRLSEPISVDEPVALVGASYGGLVCLDSTTGPRRCASTGTRRSA
jgi:hypothetical protein